MCPLDEDGFIYRPDAFDVSKLDQTGFYIRRQNTYILRLW